MRAGAGRGGAGAHTALPLCEDRPHCGGVVITLRARAQ